MVSGGVGQDLLQEKLEILENEIREANAKRNTLLASNSNSSGFFNANSMGLVEGVEVVLEPMMGSYDFASGDPYSNRNSFIPMGFEMMPSYGASRRASTEMLDDGRRRSSMIPSIPAEAGGGSRNSTRSRSSQGSRSGVVAILSPRLHSHPVNLFPKTFQLWKDYHTCILMKSIPVNLFQKPLQLWKDYHTCILMKSIPVNLLPKNLPIVERLPHMYFEVNSCQSSSRNPAIVEKITTHVS
jgi:hypothetical protein